MNKTINNTASCAIWLWNIKEGMQAKGIWKQDPVTTKTNENGEWTRLQNNRMKNFIALPFTKYIHSD